MNFIIKKWKCGGMMENKDLLQYYYECLKLESYFSSELSLIDVQDGRITDVSLQTKPAKFEKITRYIADDESCFLGFPVILSERGKYIPLSIWEFNCEDQMIYPMEQIYFHQYIFKNLSEKQLEILDPISEVAMKSPSAIIDKKGLYNELIDELGLTDHECYWEPVLFKAKKKVASNYHIMNEFEGLLEGKYSLSEASKAYFSQDYSEVKEQKNIFHVVKSNYPQNKALMYKSDLISVIQGPPGTGKTQTILNLACNELINDRTVLICSTNNQAVDNVIEKIEKEKLNDIFNGYVRLGSKGVIKKEIGHLVSRFEKISTSLDPLLKKESLQPEILKLKKESIKLQKEILDIEEIDEKLSELKINEDNIIVLMRQLIVRIQKSQTESLLEEYGTLDIDVIDMEEKLSIMMVKSDLFEKPKGIFSAIREWLNCKIYKTSQPRLMKELRKIKSSKSKILFDQIDESCPLESLAKVHDLVHYTVLTQRLEKIREEIKDLKKKAEDKEGKLNLLYEEKINNDRLIFKANWQIRTINFLSSDSKISDVQSCFTALASNNNLKDTDSCKFTAMQELFPMMFTSNLSARGTIPHGHKFDLVIVDESSQCSIPSVISLLQIAKHICFIGDEKQLSHIPSIKKDVDRKIWNTYCEHLDYCQYSYTDVSAFDRSMKVVKHELKKKHFLSHHYRCAPSIINFSNKTFYSNSLKVMTKEPEYGLYSGGVHFIDVKGKTISKSNKEEIDKVEEIINKMQEKGISNIGILTPFHKQKVSLINRFSGRAKIGTIHTFQGGECDAIIMSSVIAPGATSNQINFVQNSARLINVALTRAIKLFVLIGDENTILSSQGYLKELAEYIKNINDKGEKSLPSTIVILREKLKSSLLRKELMNQGEKAIFNKIQSIISNKEIIVYPKIPVKDTLFLDQQMEKELFRYYLMAHFDFVLYDTSTLKPLCAVELDGKYHREDMSVIENDKKKNLICDQVSFKLLRIDSREVEKDLKQLEEFINNLYL